jgi:hypothetical protein
MVRPAFQDEPPNAPRAGDVWMAFAIKSRENDTFPYVEHVGAGDGVDRLTRQEQLRIVTSFYDQGAEGLADRHMALFRDACAIQQNAQLLYSQQMLVAYTGEPVVAPVLYNERWQYRVDLPLFINRQIDRTYAVRNVASMRGTIYTDSPSNDGQNYSVPVAVDPPT